MSGGRSAQCAAARIIGKGQADGADELVATLPSTSSAVTVRPSGLPAVTVAGGSVEMINCVAARGATEIAVLVAA